MTDLPRLVAEKNKQRSALKKEYFKLLTNPFNAGGHVFDPAIQRYAAMRVTRVDHFRETPKNTLGMFLLVVIPLSATIYWIKSNRDAKEAAIRSGNVAYKDRLFKLQ